MFGSSVFVCSVEFTRLSDSWDVTTHRQLTKKDTWLAGLRKGWWPGSRRKHLTLLNWSWCWSFRETTETSRGDEEDPQSKQTDEATGRAREVSQKSGYWDKKWQLTVEWVWDTDYESGQGEVWKDWEHLLQWGTRSKRHIYHLERWTFSRQWFYMWIGSSLSVPFHDKLRPGLSTLNECSWYSMKKHEKYD